MKSLLTEQYVHLSGLSLSLSSIISWLAAISLLTFALSLLLLPLLIKRIPSDYFMNLNSTNGRKFRPTPFQISVLFIRNTAGVVLLLAGIAMLFLPGQGLLTIFLALLLLTFPGKKRLTSFCIKHEKVRKPINWMRKKVHAEPILWP